MFENNIRTNKNEKLMKIDNEDLRNMESQSWEGALASNKGMVPEKIERRNIPILAKVPPPRVQVDEDDEEMFDPKDALMEMLKEAEKKTATDPASGNTENKSEKITISR